MLFNVLKRMIERNQIEGLMDKIDIFFAAGKLNETEYSELIELLNK